MVSSIRGLDRTKTKKLAYRGNLSSFEAVNVFFFLITCGQQRAAPPVCDNRLAPVTLKGLPGFQAQIRTTQLIGLIREFSIS